MVSKKIILFILGYYLFLVAARYVPLYLDHGLRVKFIDVGQGDASLIFYRGKKILIDTGLNSQSSKTIDNNFVYPFCKFDLVVISHIQEDHAGGLRSILKRCRIGILWINDVSLTSSLGTFVTDNLAENKKIKKIINGVYTKINYTIGDLTLYTLWPSKNFYNDYMNILDMRARAAKLNDLSIVVALVYKDATVLFTGDAEADVLAKMDWEYLDSLQLLPITILKIPHHGAKKGLSAALLSKMRPEKCVISVGINSYGHPSPILLDLITPVCAVYRTDLQGDIEFTFN